LFKYVKRTVIFAHSNYRQGVSQCVSAGKPVMGLFPIGARGLAVDRLSRLQHPPPQLCTQRLIDNPNHAATAQLQPYLLARIGRNLDGHWDLLTLLAIPVTDRKRDAGRVG